MFTFWGTMLLAPRLLMEGAEFSGLKKSFVTFFVSFSVIYLLVALGIPRAKGGIFFGFVIFAGQAGTIIELVFISSYFQQLRLTPPTY